MRVDFRKASFLLSVFSLKQLPDDNLPEIAFAGRSNVGKSSLINRLIGRANYVKTSSKPGKTQSLNFFTIDQRLYLVDLPGYGFAKVSQKVRNKWLELINSYLEDRDQLAVVVVIIDLRHELKSLDRNLVDWLKFYGIPYQLVYTKADKLGKNKQLQHADALDVGLSITPDQRIIFSAKSGQGLQELQARLEQFARL